jgi:hypothetical protein
MLETQGNRRDLDSSMEGRDVTTAVRKHQQSRQQQKIQLEHQGTPTRVFMLKPVEILVEKGMLTVGKLQQELHEFNSR